MSKIKRQRLALAPSGQVFGASVLLSSIWQSECSGVVRGKHAACTSPEWVSSAGARPRHCRKHSYTIQIVQLMRNKLELERVRNECANKLQADNKREGVMRRIAKQKELQENYTDLVRSGARMNYF